MSLRHKKSGPIEKAIFVLIILAMLFMLGFSIVQFYAGFTGVKHYFGKGCGIAAVVALVIGLLLTMLLALRTSSPVGESRDWVNRGLVVLILSLPLPLAVGAFYGVLRLWGWHWGFALLFVVNGILVASVLIPFAIFAGLRDSKKKRPS